LACQNVHTCKISDFYLDQHELRNWQGYAYYLYADLSASGKLDQKLLIINETTLIMEGVGQFFSLSFALVCDMKKICLVLWPNSKKCLVTKTFDIKETEMILINSTKNVNFELNIILFFFL